MSSLNINSDFGGAALSQVTTEVETVSPYTRLLLSSTCMLYPAFHENFVSQSSDHREMGRAAVITFDRKGKSTTTPLPSSNAVGDYLRVQQADPEPVRRLFILEDLGRNYVEAFGSALRIPPAFFASQWADPSVVAFHDRDIFLRNPQRKAFTYCRFERYEIDRQPGDPGDLYCKINANVERFVCFSDKDNFWENPKLARSYHKVAFWTIPGEKGSWDALALVDPPMRSIVRTLASGELRMVHRAQDEHRSEEVCYSPLRSFEPLPSNSSEWSSETPISYDSMFDELLSIESKNLRSDITADPDSCTLLFRRILVTLWVTYLQRRYLNVMRIVCSNENHSPPARVNRSCWLQEDWDFQWQKKMFNIVVSGRHKLDVLNIEINANIRTLGMNPADLGQGPVGHISSNGNLERTPAWEREGWLSVQEWLTCTIHAADTFKQSYIQAATLQETKLSNEVAHGVAKITTITTIFVPVSTVAAFFSMGGPFLVGGVSSWAFWAVAGPLTLFTSLILFANPVAVLRRLVDGWWTSLRERRDQQLVLPVCKTSDCV